MTRYVTLNVHGLFPLTSQPALVTVTDVPVTDDGVIDDVDPRVSFAEPVSYVRQAGVYIDEGVDVPVDTGLGEGSCVRDLVTEIHGVDVGTAL